MESQAILEKDELRERARAIVDTAVPYAIHRFSTSLDRAKDQAFERDLGLSSADWRVLVSIGAYAPLSTKELSDRCQIDKSTVSRTTAALVQRGFVARKIDATDQRLVVLRLSARGRRVMRRRCPHIGRHRCRLEQHRNTPFGRHIGQPGVGRQR